MSPQDQKKVRLYIESYSNFGFIESQPECAISGEKPANGSMKPSKIKLRQETKRQDTGGEGQDF